MTRTTVVIVIMALALSACKPHFGEAPPTQDAMDQEAIKALGSTVPMTQFDRDYRQRLHDANTPEWREAKRLCQQTVLANYPNCLPVNDIVQDDQGRKAKAGEKAAVRNDEMFRRGYQYDFVRKIWLPFRSMMSAGCVSIPAYPNQPHKIGFSTWNCPVGTVLPEGIPDETFSKVEEDATN